MDSLSNQGHSVDDSREQRRKEKETKKWTLRRAKHVTYDLPVPLRERIKSLSDELRIPASQLVALALVRFLEEYDHRQVDLGKYKVPSRSPRYDWNLDIPTLNENQKKKDVLKVVKVVLK